jgi:DNA-binding LacI/PurR family transcriptional regulator
VKRPAMRDVASSADVSLKTVSRVVDGEPDVRPDTAARVESATERLGFRLVADARGEHERAACGLLGRPADRRPTALFCADNRDTFGALRAPREAPGPVAPVGFDDLELAELLPVPVTVVRDDTPRLGRIAARLACRRIAGEGGLPSREIVPCELVARGSGELAPA